jgi:hypothetical protein
MRMMYTSMCAPTSMVHKIIIMIFKQKIYQYYLQLVQDRIDVFRDMIAAYRDSKNDAKGSAGINTRQHYL